MILSDVCEFIVDCPHLTAPDEGKGYPLIRTPNVGKGRLDLNGVHRVSESVYKQRIQRGAPRANDLIFAREAPAGNVALVQENQTVCLGQRTVLIRPNVQKVNPQYLVYYLLSPKPQYELLGTANGATVAHVNLPAIRNLKIELPEKSVQDKIGTILVTYDDLIENNQKQIKLLEEAAQRLYKEWFVDLNFPGHENTKIVDGVPEGWQWCKVRDVADINSSALPKNYKEDFIDYVDLGSVRCGHIETRTRYNLNEAPGRAKRCAKDGDIIWGMVRPNLKAYALVTNPKETDVFSTGFAVLSAKKVPYSYLYCAVTQEEFVGYLVNATNGAAYPAVKPVHFEVADILKPDDKVLEQFHSVADSIYRKKEALENQNHNLRESRDLLLPKLMNGEVEV